MFQKSTKYTENKLFVYLVFSLFFIFSVSLPLLLGVITGSNISAPFFLHVKAHWKQKPTTNNCSTSNEVKQQHSLGQTNAIKTSPLNALSFKKHGTPKCQFDPICHTEFLSKGGFHDTLIVCVSFLASQLAAGSPFTETISSPSNTPATWRKWCQRSWLIHVGGEGALKQ